MGWDCGQASRAFFFSCACNRALTLWMLRAVKMHVKKLSYRRFLYTWATGKTENMHCVNRVLIKLVPLKEICFKVLTC